MSDIDPLPDVNPYSPPAPEQPDVVAPGSARPWGPWATLFWGLLIAIVILGVQTVVAVAFVVVEMAGAQQQDPAALQANLEHNGLLLSIATLLSTPAGLLVCALAIWVRRYPILEYLAVRRCRGRDLALGLGCLAIFIPASDAMTLLSGRPVVPDFMVSAWHSAGFLPLLFLTLMVAAPVGEELFFRGFLFRGWSESRLGVVGATLLTSVIWAVIHLQYDWFYLMHIVAGGLMLGWLRHRSGSTLLTILLHAVMNFVATVQTAIKVSQLP